VRVDSELATCAPAERLPFRPGNRLAKLRPRKTLPASIGGITACIVSKKAPKFGLRRKLGQWVQHTYRIGQRRTAKRRTD